MTRRLSIEDMQKLAEERGGKCLSKEYVNNKTKLKWQCTEGHEWEARPDMVKNKKSWCPDCSPKIVADKLRGSLEEMQVLAVENGGVCLSKSYTNAMDKLKWECKHGHRFELPAVEAKKRWCPFCTGSRQLTIVQLSELSKRSPEKFNSLRIHTYRTCTGCEMEYPLDEAFFRLRKSRGTFNWWCRLCERGYTKKWHQDNPEQSKLQMQRFRKLNPDYFDEWARTNPEKVREAQKKYYESGGKEYQYKWSIENPGKVKAIQKRYRINNPDKLRAKDIKRKEMERKLDSDYTDADERYTYKIFESKCANCGITEKEHKRKFNNKRLHLDHFYPLVDGHRLERTNADLLCQPCNNRKGQKRPDEFFSPEKFLEIKKKLGFK